MTLLQKEKLKKRICKECGKEWISYNHGGIKQFCSYSCANKYKWKFRERKVLPIQLPNRYQHAIHRGLVRFIRKGCTEWL